MTQNVLSFNGNKLILWYKCLLDSSLPRLRHSQTNTLCWWGIVIKIQSVWIQCYLIWMYDFLSVIPGYSLQASRIPTSSHPLGDMLGKVDFGPIRYCSVRGWWKCNYRGYYNSDTLWSSNVFVFLLVVFSCRYGTCLSPVSLLHGSSAVSERVRVP